MFMSHKYRMPFPPSVCTNNIDEQNQNAIQATQLNLKPLNMPLSNSLYCQYQIIPSECDTILFSSHLLFNDNVLFS